jgi:hypothetical protein
MAPDDDEVTRTTVNLEDRFFAVAIDLLCVLDFSGYFTRLNPHGNERSASPSRS